MSEKELMYVDDALAHLKQIDKLIESVKNDKEEDICSFLEKLQDKNNKMYKDFYKLLK